MKFIRPIFSFVTTLLIIEFLDEFIFGTREAAWPLIRDDLSLTYFQIGLMLSVPNLIGSFIEPVIGILGDVWKRRVLILGGGVVFTLALLLVAISQSFWPLLIAFILFYPASGAFVSLSQATLMDTEPERREQNMARWTFAGSLGIVVGPLVLGLTNYLGWSWRTLFFYFAALSLAAILLVWRFPFKNSKNQPVNQSDTKKDFRNGVIDALRSLQRKEVLRWLTLLQFSDLTLDILHGFLALYFVDVVGLEPSQAVIGVAVWTGMGLFGDFLLIPLLEKIPGLVYLRISALLVLLIFPLFLLIPNPIVKFILIGCLGILNAGWYAIPKGQLYSEMPGKSGSVMTVGNIFGLLGGLIPLGLGWAAQKFGLDSAIWLILLGPIALIFGIPTDRSKISDEENRS